MSKLIMTPLAANPTMVIQKSTNDLNESFSTFLTESIESFADKQINVVSDVLGIMRSNDLFNTFKNSLLRHTGNANLNEDLDQLFENTRTTLLRESSINNITPVAGLAFPVNYKLWAKTAIIKGFPTQVANIPAFSLAIMKPYLMDAGGNKHYLPNAIVDVPEMLDMPPLNDAWHNIEDLVDFDLLGDTRINGIPCSTARRDAIDPKVIISRVKMAVPTKDDDTDPKPQIVEIATNIQVDRRGIFRGKISTNSLIEGHEDEKVSDTIYGDIDFYTGIINVLSLRGMVTAVKFKGYISQENNQYGNSVSYDVDIKEIRITGGPHTNAPVTTEFIQDSMALYNIDALLELTNLLSMNAAQRLDQRLDKFVSDSYINNGFDTQFNGKFNVKPGKGMIQLPTEWRKELRPVIEWWATKIKQMTFFSEGHFFVYGNTMDIHLIPDISWTLGETKREVGGVSVGNNNFGVYTAGNVFNFVQSDIIKDGKLRMIYCPDSEKHHSYLYMPYSFNLERNTYRDPNNQLVPNITMIKRDTIEEIFPIACFIDIIGNDGSSLATYF